jgi:hypothetical protein
MPINTVMVASILMGISSSSTLLKMLSNSGEVKINLNIRTMDLSESSNLKVGDKVHYQPEHYNPDQYEVGMIKSIPEEVTGSVRVVYHCAGDWDNFMMYTSALTNLRDLHLGWPTD